MNIHIISTFFVTTPPFLHFTSISFTIKVPKNRHYITRKGPFLIKLLPNAPTFYFEGANTLTLFRLNVFLLTITDTNRLFQFYCCFSRCSNSLYHFLHRTSKHIIFYVCIISKKKQMITFQ